MACSDRSYRPVLRRARRAVVTALVLSLAAAGSARAATVALCVPAGGAVTAGSCSGAGTSVALPADAADQQALIAILPYVRFAASGVGGKPTITFSGVNVQVASGTGSTDGAINGEGNLVVGYAENPANRARTGSNDLIVGSDNGWSSYGQLIGGVHNVASGAYASAVGDSNVSSGIEFVHGRTHEPGDRSGRGGQRRPEQHRLGSALERQRRPVQPGE